MSEASLQQLQVFACNHSTPMLPPCNKRHPNESIH